MSNDLRRVAIVGSTRIPFARSNGAYSALGNLEMLTAVLGALVDKFGLKGETLGEVAAGAVIKHSRDWNLTREATLGSGLHPHTPALRCPARVRHQSYHCRSTRTADRGQAKSRLRSPAGSTRPATSRSSTALPSTTSCSRARAAGRSVSD